MNEPTRLREGGGAASRLMRGAELDVPSAARKRALAFSGAAATMAASGGAMAAGSASLMKGVLLWVAVGAAGGGLLSLAVSETVSRLDAPAAQSAQAPRRKVAPPVAAPSPQPAAVEVAEPLVAPAPTPSVSPARAPSSSGASSRPAAAPSLLEEQRVIEQVRGAIARGDATLALSMLDTYERSYSQGQFGPEALALRVEASSAQGNVEGARSLANRFERRYPHHPLLSRVQAAARR
ncbi:MAG TPA: hypothetical protein VEQ59_05825 [Polyangiaceae bacterium]|nr:hypothetical protein [Polyangiaceae bacterium]